MSTDLSNEAHNKASSLFIDKPLNLCLGITGLTSILFLDTYLALQNSSIKNMEAPEIGNVFIFLFFYFLCLHIASKPLRHLTHGLFLLIFEGIKLFFKIDLCHLVYKFDIEKDKDLVSINDLHAQALEENNTVKLDLVKEAKNKEKFVDNTKNILFILSILIPINYCHESTLTRYFSYQSDAWGIIIVISFILFWYSIYQKQDSYIRPPKIFKFEVTKKYADLNE